MPILRNPRRELFCQEKAKGATSTAAYKTAGYQGDRGNAAVLNAMPEVQARIAELMGEVVERTLITKEAITEDLMRIASNAERAARLGEVSGLNIARAALMDVAKLNGLLVEKTENTNRNYDVSDKPLSAEEWVRDHVPAGVQ